MASGLSDGREVWVMAPGYRLTKDEQNGRPDSVNLPWFDPGLDPEPERFLYGCGSWHRTRFAKPVKIRFAWSCQLITSFGHVLTHPTTAGSAAPAPRAGESAYYAGNGDCVQGAASSTGRLNLQSISPGVFETKFEGRKLAWNKALGFVLQQIVPTSD